MRVYVSSPSPAFSPQVLAYAEYRVFGALARYTGVRGARVVLQPQAGGGARCSIAIDFESTPTVRASVTGRHAAGTIDRAAKRLSELMRERFHPEVATASP